MVGTYMSADEWKRTECVRRWVVKEFGLRSWAMLSPEQGDIVVRLAVRRGIDAADRYFTAINAANWSAVSWRIAR
jgi:hypothetical protein